MSKDNSKISISVIKRLPRYYRFLGELKSNGIERISSNSLAQMMNLTASQIRQDLNCFGGFGHQGYGYNVAVLHSKIGVILGVDSKLKTILIGAGHLGNAIARHLDFEKKGCVLEAIFDIDENLMGKNICSIPIYNVAYLQEYCEKNKPVVAVLCIPKEAAQSLVDSLVSAGIRAFWNFSHYDLRCDYQENVVVENVHLGDSLLTLTYRANNEI